MSAILDALSALAVSERVLNEREEALAAIQRVRELHGPCHDDCTCTVPACHQCGRIYPCPTTKALDGNQ